MLERLKIKARRLAMGLESHGATIIAFIGAIVAVVGAVIDNQVPPPLPVSLRYLQPIGASLAAVGALLSSFQNAWLQEDLKLKTATIIDLQKRLSDSLIGGDDFAYILPGFPPVRISAPTTNSLYDLNIRYTDTALALEHSQHAAQGLYNLVSSGGSFTAEGSAPYILHHQLGTFHPNSEHRRIRDLDTGNLPTPFVIDARFTARNGQWHQVVILDIADGSGGFATVVKKGDKILYKHVDDGYPYRDKLFRDLRDQEA
jgi:hypothetical protein